MADIFSAGDPRNAVYNETLAGIGLAEETTLSGIREGLASRERGFGEAEEAQKRSEPGAYKAIDNRSNREGLLESGFEAGRTTRQEADFAAKRLARMEAEKEARTGAIKAEEVARKKGALERGGAAKTAEGEAYKERLEHPTPGTAYPIPPGQQLAIAEGVPPGPGGVVPYQGTGVRVGLPSRRSYTPGTAAAKRLGR